MSHTSSWKPLPAGKIKWGDMQWHKDVVGTRQKSTCEQCGKSFKSLEDLAIHQSIEKGHLNSSNLKKPTSVEVKAAKKSCIQLSWSVSALEEKHVSKYHIQSRSSQRSNGVWSNLGMVHPQMATFHINTALLAAMCNPTTQIGIVAVNEKQQYGIRYVIQFQRTELKIKKRRINVYEYKLEGMPWKKLDWDTDNDQSIELAKYLFTKPHTDDIGTPQNLTAYMNVKHNIVVSWFPPLEKKNEKTRQLSTEESSFTGYSVYYSKVDSNVWSWIKSLGKDARCTVISHNKIPRPSEYLVGLTANIGLHMGPMVVMCFHNWQPGVLVFQNKCCKICQKSTRGKMTISRNDGRMMVSEEDKVTKGNVKFKQLDRKDVFLSANHFYQSYEELAKGDTFSDGKALHMYVFLSVALWDNLQNALDDQGRPIHRVFVRASRCGQSKDKVEDELPECIIWVNGKPIKVQVHNGASTCKDLRVDITGKLHLHLNTVLLEIKPGCMQRYTVCVDIARKLGIKATVRHLLKEKVIPQSITKGLIKNLLTEDRAGIKYCSYKVKLTCPISQRRLEAPCKGDRCRHLQCMEVGTLIQLNETKKERLCLLCKEPYTSLCIDGLFLEILRTVPSSVTEIEFNPEGEWKPVTNTAESGPSVSIDDDAGKLTEDKQGEKVNGDECIQNEYEYESGVNSGWFFSQYGLEMDDDDIELININAGNTTSEMEAIERNRVVLMDETNGMVCENSQPTSLIEPNVLDNSDCVLKDINSVQSNSHGQGKHHTLNRSHTERNSQNIFSSQIMIEDQNTGRSVNLHEMVPLDSNKITEECSNINDPRNQDVMNMGSNLHRVSSFSNKLSIEGPVAMDTSRDGIDVERESPCGVVMGLCDKLLSKSSQHEGHSEKGGSQTIGSAKNKTPKTVGRGLYQVTLNPATFNIDHSFTCSECEFVYSSSQMFEGANKKMCLECALEQNVISKNLYTVLSTGHLQPRNFQFRINYDLFKCTECKHNYGMTKLYRVKGSEFCCINCALELNHISHETWHKLSNKKSTSFVNGIRYQDKEITDKSQANLNASIPKKDEVIDIIFAEDKKPPILENNGLTKKCYIPMCQVNWLCPDCNKGGITMSENLRWRKKACTDYLKQKTKKWRRRAEKMYWSPQKANVGNHGDGCGSGSTVYQQIAQSSKPFQDSISNVCFKCHSTQGGIKNAVWYQIKFEVFCPACFQKQFVEIRSAKANGPIDNENEHEDLEIEGQCRVLRSHQNNRQHGNTTDTNEDNLANVPNERQSIAQGHCLSEVRRASVFDSCSATLEQYTDMTSDITGLDLNSDNSSNIEECQVIKSEKNLDSMELFKGDNMSSNHYNFEANEVTVLYQSNGATVECIVQEQGAELVLENNFKEKKVIEIDDDDEEDDFDFFKHWGSVDLGKSKNEKTNFRANQRNRKENMEGESKRYVTRARKETSPLLEQRNHRIKKMDPFEFDD
ncbi:uncharacterized protein LOC128235534 [Mya arenaria]|uniref:uncharacterized protein LOC128235534 n=1 Tax=Mya arenaria TaxID=6604 RepID=UPI0022DFE22B|nr:uncharacterized protein LOC128235534 [Mya arenaria]XP_052806305.1 uncharacterized protein LOC128235534 [Mya arenaria]XP_052806306.1 uncharacterized protein LOC128235534 [Mya arenaria]XP_052806307.1 uncharacterized protein LOC128235534 [Mya arenaria]XP_052806308.1 uncharacterized protein LOC128235534 [Mya arenaria]